MQLHSGTAILVQMALIRSEACILMTIRTAFHLSCWMEQKTEKKFFRQFTEILHGVIQKMIP